MVGRYSQKSYAPRTAYRKQQVDDIRSQAHSRPARPARARRDKPAGEMKYFDTERSLTAITAATGAGWPAGTMFDPTTTINLGAAAVAGPATIFAPTVGASLNQRIGRKVQILKIRVNGTLSTLAQSGQAAADLGAKIRVVLVLDKQTNSASMVASQLFHPASTADNSLHAFQNPDNFGRFQVLKEKFITLANPSIGGATPAIDQMGLKKFFKFTIVFKEPITVNFNATNGGTIADIIDNSLHMMCSTDSTALSPQLAYYTRVCYKE